MLIEAYINTEEWRAKCLPILLLALNSLGLLVDLVFLGKAYTPQNDRVLTWGEGQLLLACHTYVRELRELQKDLDVLVQLTSQPLDPVKAQIACEQISAHTGLGLASLELQREAGGGAALDARQRVGGSLSKDEAFLVLNIAVENLNLTTRNIEEEP